MKRSDDKKGKKNDPGSVDTRWVTMRDVASAAGVGLATASRALSGDPRCAEETRVRVAEAAMKIGYVPDPGVSALARRRSRGKSRYVVAWLIEGPKKSELRGYASLLVEATREIGKRLGYEVVVEYICEHGTVGHCSRVLFHRGVQGVFLFSIHDASLLKEFDWRPFSVVAFTQENFRVPFDLVRENTFRVIFDAWEKAKEHGHQRIGVVLPSAMRARQNQEILGACAVQQQSVIAKERVPPLILKPIDGDTEHYGKQTLEWYEKFRPSCVLSKTEGALWPIKEAGYQCPQDFSFISTNLLQGTLATITGYDPMVQALAHNLMSQMDSLVRLGIRGEQPNPVTRMVESVWKQGKTLREIY